MKGKCPCRYVLSTVAFVQNILLVYVSFAVCRMAFLFENWDLLGSGFMELNPWDVVAGSVCFDTSAIMYLNVLYAFLMLLPIRLKEKTAWQKSAKAVYLLFNGVGVITNMVDCVYFRFAGRRTTATVVSEFSNEDNLLSVFGAELVSHWYLVLLTLAILWFLCRAYRMPTSAISLAGRREYVCYYSAYTFALLLFVPFAIIGMRGGATAAVRPITVSNANQYVNHPSEAAIVLNTPFSIIRTFGKRAFADPKYLPDEELAATYSPVHAPDSVGGQMRRKNVVVLIVESLGREYIGACNTHLDGGVYLGYTPFLDSLCSCSMTFEYSFCNGRKSIDGMPSILSSIPMFVEPFFLTPASMNDVGGLARELGRVGYSSAFFHGAQNGSMGFQAFARSTGFQSYYGRTEYNRDERFGGDRDFDGTWAIWDEPFLQFYALKMTEIRQPFVTAVFTASSHHPFAVPDKYSETFRDEDANPIHKCIRYADNALRLFFETARRQPWYENTIFVLTGDHTNLSDHAEYQTDLGLFCSPVIIFDPSHDIFPSGSREGVAQQIDIMPTLLAALGYPYPYVAFGKDLLSAEQSGMWAVNYSNGIYQYVRHPYLLQFDGQRTTGLYNYQKDWMLTDNLCGKDLPCEKEMERLLKALIQSYMQRMEGNQLVVR